MVFRITFLGINGLILAASKVFDGSLDYLFLNTTAAKGNSGLTGPNSSIWNMQVSSSYSNTSGRNYIAYCWHGVEGYSKFGFYKGNNSIDGPFVYTGFKPAFTICKRFDSSSGANWLIHDNKRNPHNPVDTYLIADGTSNEGDNHIGSSVDYVSNGFKIRGNDSATNASGGLYFYIAFAEMPFKYATAR